MSGGDTRRVFIGTLGCCVVVVDGKVVSGVPASFYKVAVYLLLSGNNGSLSRQRLWGVLWSEPEDGERAAANLRRALARIRALQDGLEFSLIESNFHTVHLVDDPAVNWDLRTLLSALSGKTGQIRPGSYPGELLADLDNAGPEFEEWLSNQRDDLRSQYIEHLFNNMADPAWTHAIGMSRRAIAHDILALDPCNEEVYRILMLDAASNRNTAQLQQIYQKCEAELRRELGISISSETRTLYTGLMKTLTG